MRLASRYVAIGLSMLVSTVAASSGMISTMPGRGLRAPAAGNAHLYVVGTRRALERQSPAAAKLDSMLADLTRHAALARPDHLLADLHSLSPAARFKQSSATQAPLVLIDAITRGDPQALKSALVGLGLEHAALYSNDIGGWLPLGQVEAAAARAEVLAIRAAMPRARTAAVSTQGDYAQRSDVVRANDPSLTGAGVTVGVLSDSFNCFAAYAAPGSGVPASGNQGYASNGFAADYVTDVSSGALPSNVKILEEASCLDYTFPDSQNQPTGLPFTDEGRAMLQIVHVVAPGASLAFYTASNSEADFASGMNALASAGAKVIADDFGYFDEPFFQDGLLAQAVNAVEAQGVAYFSAAGNDQMTPSYQNTAPSFKTLESGGPNAGEYLLNFDTTGATTSTVLSVTIPVLAPGQFVGVVLEWDQPYVTGSPKSPGASSQLDVCITGGTGSDVILNYDNDVVSCSGANALGADPYQVMLIGNPANAAGNTEQQDVNIAVGLANGTAAPGRILLAVEDDGLGSTIHQFANNGPTLQGHPGAAGAAAVGAAFYFDTPRCGTTPAALEPYSSAGGAPILFDTSGARLATPVIRNKPDFVGPDGVNDTFLGYTLASDSPPYPANGMLTTSISECQNNPSYPNFFGTSAATPHAAGIATLMLEANGAATPAGIYNALRTSALPMSGSTPNLNSGYGFIQADAALALIVPIPAAPTLTLAQASIALGNSTTISWSSVNAVSCAASGSWSGTLASSGSQMLTPSVEGSDMYSLTCSNAGGTSTPSTATLSVTAPPSSSGGGGLLGAGALWGLAALWATRLLGSFLIGNEHSYGRRPHDQGSDPTEDDQRPACGESTHDRPFRNQKNDDAHERDCGHPVDDRAPKQGFHWADRRELHEQRGQHAQGNDAVKAARLGYPPFEPGVPAHGLTERIGTGTGEHWNADQPNAENSEGEQREREISREGTESPCRLRSSIDIRDAGGVKCDGSRENDEVRRRVRVQHSAPRVPLDAIQLFLRRTRVDNQRCGSFTLHVLHFFGRLPEK
jgi:hypothetical protein